jgi:hypothetical protein
MHFYKPTKDAHTRFFIWNNRSHDIQRFRVTSSFKLLIFNDMHLNSSYAEECTWGKCFDLPKFGYDSSEKLIDTVILKAASELSD